jgi:predicted transcriptional regulator
MLKRAASRNTYPIMLSVTLKLSTDMAAKLERMAARRRITKSAFMREALEEKLRVSADEPSVFDLMKASVGSIDSGIRNLSHNPTKMKGFGLK